MRTERDYTGLILKNLGLSQRSYMGERLLTRREVSERLALSPVTLYRLARTGELPVVRVGRRGLRYQESTVDRFVRERVANGRPTWASSALHEGPQPG